MASPMHSRPIWKDFEKLRNSESGVSAGEGDHLRTAGNAHSVSRGSAYMHSSTMNAQECMDVVVTTGVAIGSLKMLQLLLRQTHHLIKHISTSSAQFLSSVSGLLLHRLINGRCATP